MPGETLRLKIVVDVNGEKKIQNLNTQVGHLGGKAGQRTNMTLDQMARRINHVGRVAQVVAAGGLTLLVGKFLALSGVLARISREFIDVNEKFAQLEITVGSALKNVAAARDITKELATITARSPIPFQYLAQTIQSFSVIPQTSQKILEQVVSGTLGQTDGFLHKAVGLVEAMATFRPDQGPQGAVFAIREAMGGQMRSLIRRFDIPVRLLSSASGKSLEELKADPNAMLKSMMDVFSNIISPTAIQQFARQPSILMENFMEQLLDLPALSIGRSGAYKKILIQLEKFFDEVNMFIRGEFDTAFAGRLSDVITEVFQDASANINKTFTLVAEGLGIETANKSRPEIFFEGVAVGLEKLFSAVPKFIEFINENGKSFMDAIKGFLNIAQFFVDSFVRLTEVLGGTLGTLTAIAGFYGLGHIGSIGKAAITGGGAALSGIGSVLFPGGFRNQVSTKELIAKNRAANLGSFTGRGTVVSAGRAGFQTLSDADARAYASRNLRNRALSNAGTAALGFGRTLVGGASLGLGVGAITFAIGSLVNAIFEQKRWLSDNTDALHTLHDSIGVWSDNIIIATGRRQSIEQTRYQDKETTGILRSLRSQNITESTSLFDILTNTSFGYNSIDDAMAGNATHLRNTQFDALLKSGYLQALGMDDQGIAELKSLLGMKGEEIRKAMAESLALQGYDIDELIDFQVIRQAREQRAIDRMMEEAAKFRSPAAQGFFQEYRQGNRIGTEVDIREYAEESTRFNMFRPLAQLRSGITNNVLVLESYDQAVRTMNEVNPLAQFFDRYDALQREIDNFQKGFIDSVNNFFLEQTSSEQLDSNLQQSAQTWDRMFQEGNRDFQEYFKLARNIFDVTSEKTEELTKEIVLDFQRMIQIPSIRDNLEPATLERLKQAIRDFQDGKKVSKDLLPLFDDLKDIGKDMSDFVTLVEGFARLMQLTSNATLDLQSKANLGDLLGKMPGGTKVWGEILDKNLLVTPGTSRTETDELLRQSSLYQTLLTFFSDPDLIKQLEGMGDQGKNLLETALGSRSQLQAMRNVSNFNLARTNRGSAEAAILNPTLVSASGAGARSVNEAFQNAINEPVNSYQEKVRLQGQIVELKKLERAAELAGDEEDRLRLENLRMELELSEKLLAYQNSFDSFGHSFGRGIQSQIRSIADMAQETGALVSNSLGNAFADFITGAASAKDAFRNFTVGVLQEAARMFAVQGVTRLLGAAFGFNFSSGGQVLPAERMSGVGMRAATGGLLVGGSGQRDDIPIMAMGGEYILNKEAVKKIGVERLNAWNFGNVDYYKQGGSVSSSSKSMYAGGKASEVHIHVNANGSVSSTSNASQNDAGLEIGKVLAPVVQEAMARMMVPGGHMDQWYRRKQGRGF